MEVHTVGEIQSATGDQLAEERDVLSILWFAMTVMEESNQMFVVPESDKLTIVMVLHYVRPDFVEGTSANSSGVIEDRRRLEFLELMGEQQRAVERIERATNEIDGLATWREDRRVSVDVAKRAISIARGYLAKQY